MVGTGSAARGTRAEARGNEQAGTHASREGAGAVNETWDDETWDEETGRATEVAGAAGRRRAADTKAGTADMDLRPRTPAGSAPNPEEG